MEEDVHAGKTNKSKKHRVAVHPMDLQSIKQFVGLAPRRDLTFWEEVNAEMTMSYKKYFVGSILWTF